MHPLDVKKHIFGPYPEKFATDKHWPPETTAVSVWTSARTSWVWFLKVLVLTHWLFSWPIVEARAWNWTTVPSDVPAITLLSSCRTETIRLTLQWQRHTPTNAHTHTHTCDTDRPRTSHLVIRWLLIRVPVTASQIWTFPAESPLMTVSLDRKATLQTTTSVFRVVPNPRSTRSRCVAWPEVDAKCSEQF